MKIELRWKIVFSQTWVDFVLRNKWFQRRLRIKRESCGYVDRNWSAKKIGRWERKISFYWHVCIKECLGVVVGHDEGLLRGEVGELIEDDSADGGETLDHDNIVEDQNKDHLYQHVAIVMAHFLTNQSSTTLTTHCSSLTDFSFSAGFRDTRLTSCNCLDAALS